ncbi:uncharacterized protein LOC135492573 [Lineus longissimus]|uniref:uncharacterized protein LOC135492573 n=1 Tax=Lineus longissimus TaxID=88925 RepID=UPI002B4F66CE
MASTASFDWSELNESLESKFKEYNRKFNSKVGAEHMTFSSWKHFTGNICFNHINRCDIYEALHDCGKGREGCETLQFQPFKKALEKLFGQERSRQDASCPSEVSEKVLLSEVIDSPIRVFSFSHFLKFLLAGTSANESNISKYASESGATLKAMAKTSINELTDIGVGVGWIGPVAALLKKIWEHLKAYRDIPVVLKHFAEMLVYLTDVLDFIKRNELYEVEMTRRRLNGLEEILKESKLLFEKASKKSAKKVSKFFEAPENIEILKDQENKIVNWMQSVYFMQLTENQQLNKEMHKDIKEVLQAVVQSKTKRDVIGEMFVTFLCGIYRRGFDEDGFKKTVEEIFRRFDISPPDEGVSVPGRGFPSQVQPGEGIQALSQGNSGPIQAADDEASGPVSYSIGEISMSAPPVGPTLQMTHRKRQPDSPSSRPSQTHGHGPSDSVSPSTSRKGNFTDTQPRSGSQIEPEVPVIPSAPPESIPPGQNQYNMPPSENQASSTTPTPRGEGHIHGNPVRPKAPPVERHQRPLPSNTSATELILKEGEDISDVLLWVSDHFGNSGFLNFARSLPGPERLNTPDIHAAEYELDRHHSLPERNMAVLEYWHQRNPAQCTVNTMYQMLKKIGKNEMAKNLKERWCHSVSPSPRAAVVTASGGPNIDSANLATPLDNSTSRAVSPSPRAAVVTASGRPNIDSANPATPLDNSTSRAGDVVDVVSYPEYDFLILHEEEDLEDVTALKELFMKNLNGAEVAILADFHTEGSRPDPLKVGLEKTTLVAFYISKNTANKNRENSIIAKLNFELVIESGLKFFIIYKNDGAGVTELLKGDMSYLKAFASASMTYDVTEQNFMKRMNDWFTRNKHRTEERRKKCLSP